VFTLVLIKCEARKIACVSGLICKRPETVMFFLGHDAANPNCFVDRVSVSLRR
jgi:hypothetical protein